MSEWSSQCARLKFIGAVNDTGALRGWVDGALAIDIRRAQRLEQRGYRVWTQAIPAEVTPKNRLLMGARFPENSGTPEQ